MSPLQEISASGAPAAIGPYAQAVRAGDWVHCSGQIALDPESGELVEDGVEAQTRRVLSSLRAVLEEAGLSLDRVVKTTVYLADLGDFAAMNGVYAEHFGNHRPARATVAVAGLPRGVAVEIDAVAYAG